MYMTLCDPTQPYMTIHNATGSYVTLHNPTWPFLNISEWLRLPTTANLIPGINLPSLHETLIFPTTLLKSIHSPNLHEIADFNEPAMRLYSQYNSLF